MRLRTGRFEFTSLKSSSVLALQPAVGALIRVRDPLLVARLVGSRDACAYHAVKLTRRHVCSMVVRLTD